MACFTPTRGRCVVCGKRDRAACYWSWQNMLIKQWHCGECIVWSARIQEGIP